MTNGMKLTVPCVACKGLAVLDALSGFLQPVACNKVWGLVSEFVTMEGFVKKFPLIYRRP
jgi:hypothetical protein